MKNKSEAVTGEGNAPRGEHGETPEELVQAENLANLLWDSLKRDPEHKDRRRTAYGTKTKLGLLRSVLAVIEKV